MHLCCSRTESLILAFEDCSDLVSSHQADQIFTSLSTLLPQPSQYHLWWSASQEAFQGIGVSWTSSSFYVHQLLFYSAVWNSNTLIKDWLFLSPTLGLLEERRYCDYLSNGFSLMFWKVAFASSHYLWVQGRKNREWVRDVPFVSVILYWEGKEVFLPDFYLRIIDLITYYMTHILITCIIPLHISHIIIRHILPHIIWAYLAAREAW